MGGNAKTINTRLKGGDVMNESYWQNQIKKGLRHARKDLASMRKMGLAEYNPELVTVLKGLFAHLSNDINDNKQKAARKQLKVIQYLLLQGFYLLWKKR